VSPIANLAYHLDCLGHQISCTLGAYETLWRNTWSWTPEDDAQLQAWRALKQRYPRTVRTGSKPDPGAIPSALPIGSLRLDLDKIRRLASTLVDDLALYQETLSLTMHASDAARAVEIMAHFMPRFRQWWDKDNHGAQLGAWQRRLEETIVATQLVERLEQVAAFYGAELHSSVPLVADLILLPGNGARSRAERLENHAFVEIASTTSDARERLPIIAHEFFHHFMNMSPTAHRRAVLDQLAASDDACAIAAWNLLDETLATTLGNAWVASHLLPEAELQARLDDPKRLYADPFIGPTAARLYPALRDAINTSQGMNHPAFIKAYLSAFNPSVANEGGCLRPMLFTAGIAHDNAFRSTVRHAARTLKIRSLSTYRGLQERSRHSVDAYPMMTTLIMVHPDRTKALKRWSDTLGSSHTTAIVRSAKDAPLIYGVPRPGGNAWLLVLMARTDDEFKGLLDRLNTTQTPTEGVWIHTP
ncbi:MAG: hypothetical protein AAFS10_22165, partial [Myxococcota bacterium]